MSTILEQLIASIDKQDSPERLAMFEGVGVEFYADAEYLNLLKKALIELYTDGSGSIDQNNVGKVVNVGFVFGNSSILNKLNAMILMVRPIDTPVLIVSNVVTTDTFITKKYVHSFNRGKGVYGAIGGTIEMADLELISVGNLTLNEVLSLSNTFTIPLGPLPDHTFLPSLNTIEHDVSNTNLEYFVSYIIGGKTYLQYFVGDPGVYGGAGTLFTANQFIGVTDSDVAEDITHTSQLINNGTGASPFATVAEVNGMDIIVDQAAAEMYLKNNEGVTLATVSLAFLNNEGTTFFYNTTTKNLELKNEAGEVLSVVPVSAFVSNLIQSVNFNGATPSILEFKDSTGTVVTSVTFTINNIAGLQAILDLKAPLANPAFSGVPTVPTAAINDNTLQIANAAFVQNVANSKVAQTVIDNVTASAPSQNAIYDNFRRWVSNPETNLNNFQETGSFLTAGASLTNLPNGWAQGRHMIIVSGSVGSTYATQIITNLATGLTAFRKLSGTDWSEWVEYSDVKKTLTLGAHIQASIDLNTYQTTGLFLGTAANATLELNYPTLDGGMLEVTFGTSNQVFQKYHTITSNDLWIRKKLSANWTQWKRLANNVDLDLKADKTAAFPTTYLAPVNAVSISTGSINDAPKGNYVSVIASAVTDVPFPQPAALLSLGNATLGGQFLIGRNSNDVYYRSVLSGFQNWRKLVNDLDLSTKQDALTGSQSNIVRGDGTPRNKDLFVFLDTVLPPSGFTPVNTAIVAGDTASAIASKAQGQINAIKADSGTIPNKVTKGGDSDGARLIIGTNDLQDVEIRRDGVEKIKIDGHGTIISSSNNTGGTLLKLYHSVSGNTGDLLSAVQLTGAIPLVMAGIRSSGNVYGAAATAGNDYMRKDQVDAALATKPTIGYTAPASATAPGIKGEIRITATYVYYCVNTNTWVRSAVATW